MKAATAIAILATLPLGLGSCSKPAGKPVGGAGGGGAGADDAYPLTTCVVSGEKLGEMGAPVVYKHGDTTVKFCCKSCIPEFEKEPEKFLAKLKK